MIRGYDVSAYQGTSVPAADFVFVKATEGATYTSGKYGPQWASAGLKATVRGAYHFARPEQSSAVSQADRFVTKVGAKPGEMLCLDLEASGLSQSATNAWAKKFGDRLRERCPGVTTVAYLGSGYATNSTGRGLNEHFDFWWYPAYGTNRPSTAWPAGFDPWLPSGLTVGWDRPHIWQFTSNYAGQYDANVSWLTIDQLAGGGGRSSQEDDVAGLVSVGSGSQVIKAGAEDAVYFTTEWGDTGGFFQKDDKGGAYSIVILGKDDGKLWAQCSAQFKLIGLQAGDKVRVSWDRMSAPAKTGDPWQVKDHAWGKPYYASAEGTVEDELGGSFGLDSSVRLRLRVYNESARDVKVESAMAKVLLFHY